MTDSTNVPSHDPAASSMPRIPTYWSETLGRRVTIPDEVVRERHDEADPSYDRGARDMALRVLRALDRDLGPEVVGTLRVLEYRPLDYVPAVLRSLDGLVGAAASLDAQHAEGGERS